MKIEQEIWEQKMNNLLERRKERPASTPQKSSIQSKLSDYKSHLSKVYIGKSVLDIGCGSMAVKEHLPSETDYIGIDPFPVSSQIIKKSIESCVSENDSFDTLICFAALDNFYNLDLAFQNMRRMAKKNIVFLTGIDIEPDQYHTFNINLNYLRGMMAGWKEQYLEYLSEKVILIEFRRYATSFK